MKRTAKKRKTKSPLITTNRQHVYVRILQNYIITQNIVRFKNSYLTCANACLFNAIHSGK